MCRLLYIRSNSPITISTHLRAFAQSVKLSKEYQGDGWGIFYLNPSNEWSSHVEITPIWKSNFNQFPKTKLVIAHARSAFLGTDICIENNMPFWDGRYAFIFNGELHGVKIRADGKIGAEKIFNFIKRFNQTNNILQAIKKGITIIENRSDYIKAMNIIIADKEHAYLSTFFNEDPAYFTMYEMITDDLLILSSIPYFDADWIPISNKTIKVY
ncbi:MAG: class II glutamine amidotransferase [Candidatus Hermodarchaeota archaeon]